MENIGGFGHFYHEGRAARRQIIGRTNTGEYFVDRANLCLFGGYIATNVRHKHY